MTLIKFQKEMPSRSTSAFPAYGELFNNLFDGMVTSDFRKWNAPAVNIVEDENAYNLQIAAPGMNKNDFKLGVENNVLTVSAQQKQEETQKTVKYSRQEFSFTSFSRSFTLPEAIDIEKIQANYENGILTVSLPMKEEAKPKSREITIA